MKGKIAIFIAVASLAAMPALSQQSLGDVAGSIKLKRPQGEPVVVDESTVSQNVSRTRASSVSGDLERFAESCRETAQTVASLLADLPRKITVPYGEELRSQLESARLQLETDRNDLALFVDATRLQSVLDSLERGISESLEALSEALPAVANNEIVFPQTRRLADHGVQLIGDALSDVRAVQRAEASAAPPPPIDPIAADASIKGVCGRSFGEGSDRYQDCIARQEAAISNIMGRSGLASGIDDATFNTIRNQCRYEWPDDYVARDGCERRRVADSR